MLFLPRRSKIQWYKVLTVFMLCTCSATLPAGSYDNSSTSKRIEVYSLSQNYWDTQQGDTLSRIVFHLLPNNPSKRAALQQDILHLNPDAFIGGDPARLLAGKRLWLPGYMKQPDSKADPATTTVETYSWGNIKRPRE
jgi:hypothetical protein